MYRKILECLDTRSTWNNIRRFFGEYLRNTLDVRRFKHTWENICGVLRELEILGEICRYVNVWKIGNIWGNIWGSIWVFEGLARGSNMTTPATASVPHLGQSLHKSPSPSCNITLLPQLHKCCSDCSGLFDYWDLSVIGLRRLFEPNRAHTNGR